MMHEYYVTTWIDEATGKARGEAITHLDLNDLIDEYFVDFDEVSEPNDHLVTMHVTVPSTGNPTVEKVDVLACAQEYIDAGIAEREHERQESQRGWIGSGRHVA